MMDETTLRQVAWIGDQFVIGAVRGVILVFHGLGSIGLRSGPGFEEQEWAANGGLVVVPYYGPWSWMNRSSRASIDQLVLSVYEHFELAADIPLIVTGGSMGGQGALIYTRYSPHRIAACLAQYPVCDLEYHFTERPDLPTTMRYAYRDYPGDLASALVEHSPLKQVGAMPDIPYLVVHGDKDLAVNKERHSDRFVAEMRRHGRNIDYLEVPGMGHANGIPYYATRKQIDFVKGFLNG
jgi:dipeptidyl aminopeptidase/acylaminoacyl peptidase